MVIFNKDGTVAANAGYSAGHCLEQIPCDSRATPPCSLPTTWGWPFVIIMGVTAALYVAGGVTYTVRVKGEDGFVRASLATRIPQLEPYIPHILQ